MIIGNILDVDKVKNVIKGSEFVFNIVQIFSLF